MMEDGAIEGDLVTRCFPIENVLVGFASIKEPSSSVCSSR